MKIEDIIESLNFTTNIAWNGDVGTFEVNNQKFVITVRPANANERQTFVPFFGNRANVGNVDFSAVTPDGTLTQDLTSTSGATAMKVFSVVAQAVAEQIAQHQYNIVVCVAKQSASPTNYTNRVVAYETIIERAARKAGMLSMTLVSNVTETVYVVYKLELHAEMQHVKQHLDT
jgi:hypothetical protein